MKIFITADNMFWEPDSKVFEPYKDDVIIVETSSHKRRNSNGMKVVSSGVKHVWLGQSTPHYEDFEGLKDALLKDDRLHDEGEDLIVLADNSPASLIIFKVLQDSEKDKHLHLWAVRPFSFEEKSRCQSVAEMLSDFTGVTSVLIENMDEFISMVDNSSTGFEVARRIFEKRLPEYLKKIEELDYSDFWPTEDEGAYFYDIANEKFISTRQSSLDWMCEYNEEGCLPMGMIAAPEHVISDGVSIEEITRPYPRQDGKEVCRTLRELRIKFAEANELDFEEEECPYNGPCAGSCPHCDNLLDELSYAREIIAEEKGVDEEDVTLVYPKVEINRFREKGEIIYTEKDNAPMLVGMAATPYEVGDTNE